MTEKLGLADYHVHTRLCGHAEGEPEDYLRQAAKLGIDELGFADHCPWPEGFDADSRMAPERFADYRYIIEKCRESAGEFGVTVRFGLEVDYVPGKLREISEKLGNEDFDYLIGSIHHVGDFPFDNPLTLPQWQDPSVRRHVWESYPRLLEAMLYDMDFDIIGHIDLPKKFAYVPEDRPAYLEAMHSCLELAANKGKVMEINTAGLRKAAGEIYPAVDILKMATELGVEICFGSDAHSPGDVGANFKEALRAVGDAGFTHYTRFTGRRPGKFPLPRAAGDEKVR